MHMINTTTFELEFFIGQCHFPYAILSRTWGADEVTFADFYEKQREAYENKAGFIKIQHTCHQAKKDGLKYAWVDTCCINKDSSAELSKAINSMYRWYQNAAVCYAYVSDFQEPYDLSRLGHCRWFSRGWTLQELLAPKHVVFYGDAWTVVGTKGEISEILQHITGIPPEILSGAKAPKTVSVAARMSWAAKRETTRVEDMAYCLLGIFDVSMPLLYGEETKAFLRLQGEILSQTQDDSLFAWSASGESAARFPYRGLFASNPGEFAGCGNIKRLDVDTDNTTTLLGNGRISLSCGLGEIGMETGTRRTLVAINCYRQSHLDPLAIEVSRDRGRTYLRSDPSRIFSTPVELFDQDIVIEKYVERVNLVTTPPMHLRGSILLRDIPETLKLVGTIPSRLEHSHKRRLSAVDALGARKVAFHFRVRDTNRDLWLIFWVDRPVYRYLFDLVGDEVAITFDPIPLPRDKPTDLELRRQLESIGTPQELTKCHLIMDWLKVEVCPTWGVLDEFEVMFVRLSTVVNEKLKNDRRREMEKIERDRQIERDRREEMTRIERDEQIESEWDMVTDSIPPL